MRPRARLGRVRTVSEFNMLSKSCRPGSMMSELTRGTNVCAASIASRARKGLPLHATGAAQLRWHQCVLMCGACWNATTPHLACTAAGRLENFFGTITTKSSTTGKRKEPESTGKGKGAAAAKKSKGAGVGKSKK